MLRSATFELVRARDDADILWTGEHIRDFGGAEGTTRFNQFPHESVLTSKNLLTETLRASHGRGLRWLPDTYTLPQELPEFVADWRREVAEGEPPTYLLKPWNKSRSRGLAVVRELGAALALCAADFGPRLASRYVGRPVLLGGRKFDARVYVAVRSLAPPRLFLHTSWHVAAGTLPCELGVTCPRRARCSIGTRASAFN
jgi:hypothetical protein